MVYCRRRAVKETAHKLRRKLGKPGLLEADRDCFKKIDGPVSGAVLPGTCGDGREIRLCNGSSR